MNKCVDVADFHTHILPKVDHGSRSLDISLSQLQLARDFGISRILSTSHFYPHTHTLDSFLNFRNRAVNELLSHQKDSKPEIKIGAEVLLCQGLERFESLDKLCFSQTNYLLLELPFVDFKKEYCYTIDELLNSGFDIILAHADRYPPEHINCLIDVGVNKLQLNASALATLIKRKHLYSWIESGFVVALGSDIHGKDSKAYKNFSKAKAKLGTKLSIIKEKSDKIWSEIGTIS